MSDEEKRTLAARKAGSVKSERKRVQSAKNLALARERKAEIFRMYRREKVRRKPSAKSSATTTTNAGA